MKLITTFILSVLVLTCSINTYGSDHDFCDYLEKNTHVFSSAEQCSIPIKTHEEVKITPALLGIGLSTIGSIYLAKFMTTGYVAIESLRSLRYLSESYSNTRYNSALTFTANLNLILLEMALTESLKSCAIGAPISYLGYKQLEKSGLSKKIKKSIFGLLGY